MSASLVGSEMCIRDSIRTKGLYIFKGTKIKTNKETEMPTNKPLHIAPAKKADANSTDVSGGSNKSVIFPATFALNNDDEVLPKAFCIIAITIKPGAKNSKKGISSTNFEDLPKANAKIIKKRSVVNAGPKIV